MAQYKWNCKNPRISIQAFLVLADSIYMSHLTYAVKEIRKRYEGDVPITVVSGFVKEKLAAGVDAEDTVDLFFAHHPDHDKDYDKNRWAHEEIGSQSRQQDLITAHRSSIEEGLKAFGLDERVTCGAIEPNYYEGWYRVSLTIDSKEQIDRLCTSVEGAISNTGTLINKYGVDAFSAFIGMLHAPETNSGPRA